MALRTAGVSWVNLHTWEPCPPSKEQTCNNSKSDKHCGQQRHSPPWLWLTRVEKSAMRSSCRLLQLRTDLWEKTSPTHTRRDLSLRLDPPKNLCGNHLRGKMFTQVCAINISHVWSWDLCVIVHVFYIPVLCEYWVWSMFRINWRVINVTYISASWLLCDADFTQRLFWFLFWNLNMLNNSWLIWF